MNDEMNEKVVGVVIKGGKVTSALLAKALLKVLKSMHQHHKEKAAIKPKKISMKKLMAETGGDVQDIEITNDNIKSFREVRPAKWRPLLFETCGRQQAYCGFQGQERFGHDRRV